MTSSDNQIIIKIPNTFPPERNYILNIILTELLGLSYSTSPDENIKDYQFILPNKNILIIQDHFFNHCNEPLEYLTEKNIPGHVQLTKNRFTPERDIVVLFGSGDLKIAEEKNINYLICSIDIFAGAFFMLSRWEEYVIKKRDEHNRFTSEFSLAYKNNFLHRPIVNEYSEMLWNMLVYLGYSGKRKTKKFELELTHDVDLLLYIKNLKEMLKRAAGDILKRQNIRLASQTVKIFLSAKLGRKKDPYDSYCYLMDISERLNVKSRFNFLTGKTTIYDPDNFIHKKWTTRLIKKIVQRGHIIGFHPSYNTYNNKDLWKREYQRISSISPQPVKTGRQHYLRFTIPDTWQIWDDHNMEYDSTLAYSDRAGFRCGICDLYSVFNILSRKKLSLKEKPLIAMDASFVEYQKYSPEKTKEQIIHLINVVKKYKGTFVLLWHNSSFYIPPWDQYQYIYQEIILNQL
jgi:hypothetical protein